MENKETTTKQKMLPLSNDYVFKRIFGKDGNQQILKDLLEDILNIKIESIEIKNPEIPKEVIDEKLSVLDIKAVINQNTNIDIEMQVGNMQAIRRRLVVYNAKMVASDIKVGQDYGKAKNAIVICIVNDNILERNAYLNVVGLRYEETDPKRYVDVGYEKEEECMTDMVKYYIIELQKIKGKKEEVTDSLEKWLLIIGGDEEIMEKCKKEKGAKKEAIEQLEKMSADEKEREIYEAREKGLIAYQMDMYESAKQGREEGRQEGRQEGEKKQKNEIAKKLLAKGMSIEEIKEITDLSDEELQKLKK